MAMPVAMLVLMYLLLPVMLQIRALLRHVPARVPVARIATTSCDGAAAYVPQHREQRMPTVRFVRLAAIGQAVRASRQFSSRAR